MNFFPGKPLITTDFRQQGGMGRQHRDVMLVETVRPKGLKNDFFAVFQAFAVIMADVLPDLRPFQPIRSKTK